MDAIKSYRDLRVWQAAMDLVEIIYRLTVDFPRREIFNLVSGLLRTAVAVPSKIASGHSSEDVKDYLYHLNQCQTLLSDMATQIEVCTRLTYISRELEVEVVKQIPTPFPVSSPPRLGLLNPPKPPTRSWLSSKCWAEMTASIP
jgi:four helix bundle protein